MKLTNPNYCATIVKIDKTNTLEGCDNLVGINMFGYNIIAHKSIDVDTLHILFTTETQLNEFYVRRNNLFSSTSLNDDVTIKGYIGKTRRVRAIKLRGHASNAMLMPIGSLKVLGINVDKLNEGDTFNEVENQIICKKYELEVKASSSGNKVKGQTKKYERIDGRHFPEHFSTEQWGRNEHKYSDEDTLIVTQKLHGTSVRLGHVKVKVKPTFIDRLLGRQKTEYDHLAGSRRVIKDLKSEKQFNHYYRADEGSLDIFNRALETVRGVLPKDVILYAEIVGYDGNSPIQKGYTYSYSEGQFGVYVYRITSINSDGQDVDWGWDTVRGWCEANQVSHVPELWRGIKLRFNVEDYMNENYSEELWEIDQPVMLDSDLVDEGICIRREGLNPYITKAKSPEFYEYETKMLDEGVKISS